MVNRTLNSHARLSVAPMMDWTDMHCRNLYRTLSGQALLYTEMVTAPALVRGGAVHLLEHQDAEHPIALQLGGSDPKELARAARMGADHDYDEINLNVGCPSDRVQSGAFGAVLMKTPDLVAESVSEMIAAQPAEVTVKCRIGVDDQDPEEVLPGFITKMRDAGVRRLSIHARKAWLQGLSPKENRDIPPLNYDLVYRMKQAFPDLHLSVNGGVASLAEAQVHLDAGMDGVMIGRAAYQRPWDILGRADSLIYDQTDKTEDAKKAVLAYMPYFEEHLARGGRFLSVARHMLGMFSGQPGARQWRRILSEKGHLDGAGIAVLTEALAAVGSDVLAPAV